MKYQVFAALAPLTLLLTACTSVEPAYKDIGSRMGSCVDGGPDRVAQQFYDLHLQQPTQGIPNSQQLAKYRPYLSDNLYRSLLKTGTEAQKHPELQGDLFSSLARGATAASVSDASSIPNTDAHNIPLRVTLSRDGLKTVQWQDEVLMVREGACWVVSDIRYLGGSPHISGGSLHEQLAR